MAQPKIEIPVDKIADFCRRHHIRSLSIFGSVLREDFGPDSDVDVLVEFEPDAQVGFIALSRMRRELEELLQRPVDLVPKRGLKPKIRETVLSSMEVIYAAQSCRDSRGRVRGWPKSPATSRPQRSRRTVITRAGGTQTCPDACESSTT